MIFSIPDEHKFSCGIYIIKCLNGDASYIGATTNFFVRYKQHLCKMVYMNKGKKTRLYDYAKIHGHDDLSMEVYEICKQGELKLKEKKAIKLLRPSLNTTYTGRSPVYKYHTPEYRPIIKTSFLSSSTRSDIKPMKVTSKNKNNMLRFLGIEKLKRA